MIGGTKVLLRDLQFCHYGCRFQAGKQRTIGLARLEIDGSVLDLQDDIVEELPVEGLELLVGLLGTVGVVGSIDKSAPHDDAFVRLQCLRQHVCPFGMTTTIVARTRFALRVCLHQETSKVGNQSVDLVNLLFPPHDDALVQRIGSGQTTQADG